MLTFAKSISGWWNVWSFAGIQSWSKQKYGGRGKVCESPELRNIWRHRECLNQTLCRSRQAGFRISTGYWKLWVCWWWEVRDRHSLSFAASEYLQKIWWKSIKYCKISQSRPEWQTDISVWLQPGRGLLTCCLLVFIYTNNTKVTSTIDLMGRTTVWVLIWNIKTFSFKRKVDAIKGCQEKASCCIMGNVVSSLLSCTLTSNQDISCIIFGFTAVLLQNV